jgi:hypothetical protein
MTKDIAFIILCSFVLLLISGKLKASVYHSSFSQFKKYNNKDTIGIRQEYKPPKEIRPIILNDSTAIKIWLIDGPCRSRKIYFQKYAFKLPIVKPEDVIVNVPAAGEEPKRKSLRGDLSYEFSSHTSPDTSYPGSSFHQNYVIANIYTAINNKYPVIFHFGSLQTSVPYIRNNLDISMQFDSRQYNSDMADRMRKQYQDKISQTEKQDSSLYRGMLANYKTTQGLTNWLFADKQVQQLMQSNQILQQYERSGHGMNAGSVANGLSNSDSSHKDSSLISAQSDMSQIKNGIHSPSIEQGLSKQGSENLPDSSMQSEGMVKKALKFIKEYNSKLKQLEKLSKDRDSLTHSYDSLSKSLKSGKDSLNNSLKDEETEGGDNKSDTSQKHHSDHWISGLKQLGIGRSFINYSPLSAMNLSVFGINAEYYDRYYFALAAGKTDFRYQDFLTSTPLPKQYLFLARFGTGPKRGRHLYFTFYTGAKQSSYYINNQPATAKLSGFTIEANIPLSKNINFTAEVAKSTAPPFILSNQKPVSLISFNDRNNEAYSFQANSYFPKTDTRILCIYNRYGIYFQSFSVYNNNSNTSSWQLRLDQYLLGKKLIVSASVRQNDYSNPFIVNNYKSQTLVYSVQTTLRLRKWPTLTLGYLPFSQLTILQGQLTENRFYTLMGSSNYSYKIKKIFMNSSITYTQYFNSSNQIGFLYYNSKSWFFNQTVFLDRFTLTGAATVSRSEDYHLVSAGPAIQWRVFNALSVGCGVKYNLLNHTQENLGYSGNMDVLIRKLGKIGASFDKGFIPSQNDQFFRNNWGRLTYSKNF